MLRAAGRGTYGSVMEGGSPIAAEESSKSTEVFGGYVPLDIRIASDEAFPEAGENNRAGSQSFPTLKSSLGDRMAQPAPPPEPPASSIASPELHTDAVPISLPVVIEKALLKVERLQHAPSSLQRNGFPLGPVGLIAAFGTMFLAGLLSAWVFYSMKNPPVAPPTPVAPPMLSVAPQQPDLVWPDLLATGAVSPRGLTSNGITSDQAFEFADAKLRGIDGPADAEEARYWLRVAVAKALGSERLRWALTQLGTLYARPVASPSDFATARAVWELAAAKRDPVALCFLARLEEGGNGAPPNKALALLLFRQAKETGQCSGSEQAIERLSR